MVSLLDPLLESKTISTDVYVQQSVEWTEYTAPTLSLILISMP